MKLSKLYSNFDNEFPPIYFNTGGSYLKCLDIKNYKDVPLPYYFNSSVSCVDVSKDFIASAGNDKTIKVWDLKNKESVRLLQDHSDVVSSVAILGNLLVSGSHDKTVKVWDIKTGECIKTLTGHSDVVSSVAISGNLLVSGSHDETVKVWDIETGECINTLNFHLDIVSSVAISGNFLVSGSHDNTINVWDIENDKLIKTLTGHSDVVSSVAISGNLLVSGSHDETVKVWDIETGECINTLNFHLDIVSSVAISGNFLVSGSHDNTINVWDIENDKLIKTLTGHSDVVSSVAISNSLIVFGLNSSRHYANLLNVVFAEIKKPKDEKSDSHNLGKTTLIELLDFLFLQELKTNTNSFLCSNKILFQNFVFYLEIYLNSGKYLTVSRNVAEHTKISFKFHSKKHEDFSNINEDQWDKKAIPIKKAKEILDSYLDLDVIKPWNYRYGISYFLRKQQDYQDYFQTSKFIRSKDKDWKPYIAKVLGFNGDSLRQKYNLDNDIKDHETDKKKIEKKVCFSEVEYYKLQDIIRIETKNCQELEKDLDSFSFKKEEEKISREVIDRIENNVSVLNSQKLNVEYEIDKIKKSLTTKLSFDLNKIENIYKEVGIYFPDQIIKNYKELVNFNKKISSERNSSLKERLSELEGELNELIQEKSILDSQRSHYLKMLGESDTFTKYKSFQKKLASKQAEIIKLEEQFTQLQELKDLSSKIDALLNDQKKLLEHIEKQINYPNYIAKQIKTDFNCLVKEVLNLNGILSFSINKEKNLVFEISTFDDSNYTKRTDQDKGHTYRKLLCALFDLAVLRTYSNNNFYRFVYHDGIFESLDDRKKKALLRIIEDTCKNYGVQYIMSVIDTDIPRDDKDQKINFLESDIVRKLNDKDKDGRLFKIRKF